jgi:predicted ABC-type ATPase
MIESGGHYYREDELREIENYESEIELLAELENLADRLELINDTIAARVEAARAVDAEWGEIGRALGITGDTARKRYSK